MVNRSAYDETFEKIKNIYSHYSTLDFENSLNQMVSTRDNFDIKLMFVGHFNAGKSSLLNALIGKPNYLKEAQVPKTAIAAELIYDEQESAFAYDVNGNKEVLDTKKDYLSDKYNHLEYRLNIPALEKVRDFTIVDTPGFDAGIEAHAKALANYIGVGSAYIVVIDQEKGGIDQTTLDFIQEISNYSSQIAVLINKCEKITTENAERIAESARVTLATYGLPYKVYTVSSRDTNVSDKLISIILSFNAQAAFDKAMTKCIKSELISIEKILSVTKKKSFLDTFELDADISSYSRLEEQLSETFEKKKEEAGEELNNIVQETIDKVRGSLILQADTVVDALISGNKVAAEAIIVETVRPIMLATMKDISMRQINDVTDSLSFTGLVDESESQDLKELASNLAANIKDLIEQGNFGSDKKNITDIEDVEKKKNLYHMITGIAAIATDFIAPWMEVIIILLPDVINFLNGIFKENDNELAKRRFINNVVPQVINKIYPQIEQNVQMTTNAVINEYEEKLTEKIKNIKNSIAEAENKKKQKIEDFENYKEMISTDIIIAQKLLEEMR